MYRMSSQSNVARWLILAVFVALFAFVLVPDSTAMPIQDEGVVIHPKKVFRNQIAFHDRPELIGWAGSGVLQGFIKFLTILAGQAGQRLYQQVVLALEMQVNDALRQAGFLRDIAERRAAQTLAGDAFHRCINELLTPRGA